MPENNKHKNTLSIGFLTLKHYLTTVLSVRPSLEHHGLDVDPRDSSLHRGRHGAHLQVGDILESAQDRSLTSFPCRFREVLENLIAPKPRRMSAADHDELSDLLLAKDEELKAALKVSYPQMRFGRWTSLNELYLFVGGPATGGDRGDDRGGAGGDKEAGR